MKRFSIVFAALAASLFAQPKTATALDRYVAKPDPAYKWELTRTIPGQGYTAYVLNVTSQRWLTTAEVDRPEWKHWVTVVKPDVVESDVALLMIGGGNNNNAAPDKADAFIASMALKTKTVTVELRMIPNQALSFFGEQRKRTEDSIIAFTWKKYLETGEERWPARLPMTKGAVRAMDATEGFLASEQGGRTKVARWVVTGGSKRGWTTWTAGIVDKRVIAIMPVVIDMLNMEPSFTHHWRAYGFWAPSVGDYVEHGVMDWVGTKQFHDLMKIVEPYQYRERLTIPKYIVNSSGDQFFLPDSSQFYFKDLVGEKYLRYVPNTDHGVTRRSDAGESLAVYYESIVKGWKRPEFSWTISKDGEIAVTCKDKPSAVKVWRAVNPDARDFRLEKIGPAYRSRDLALSTDGKYVVQVEKPVQGFSANFVELSFATPGGGTWKFTTDVKVVPDVYPFPAPSPKMPAGGTPLE
ncbi:MAG: PhoPQ-activated pathogenicity-related family protein [Candidatus Solibacter usitatus]|nr:PhoPQ-activated pathogenicity-related family protein [Candidatus Solibacter usitatus]